MKIINKHNFFCIVCVIYTVLSVCKIVLEAFVQGIFGNYQENLLVMFFLSLVATFVLSQYYRFQKYPLLICIVVQYIILLALAMLAIWFSGQFNPLHKDAYKDMFWSFSVPYAAGAVIYYISLFNEIRRANQSLKKIKESARNYKD